VVARTFVADALLPISAAMVIPGYSVLLFSSVTGYSGCEIAAPYDHASPNDT
jgi:hypothetical protein